MRRSFDISMGQLGKMTFRHAEFTMGHLDMEASDPEGHHYPP